jgi:Glycosyl hydrolases family 43
MAGTTITETKLEGSGGRSTSPPEPSWGSPAGGIAVVVGVMAVVAFVRQGAFYPVDAFGLALVAVPLTAWSFAAGRDRLAVAAAALFAALALWWLVRALMERNPSAFLPFGASVLCFLLAFLTVRLLRDDDRSRAAVGIVALGSLASAVGLVGVLVHWQLVAQREQGVWVISTTLSYPAASAVVFAIALFLALSFDLGARTTRVAVCLCLAGFIGTWSKWDLLALGCGAVAVPARRWLLALWPLTMGLAAGVAVVVSAHGSRTDWLALTGLVLAVCLAALTKPRSISRSAPRLHIVGLLVVAGMAVLVVVSPPVDGGSPQPSGHGQVQAWTSAEQALRNSLVTGTGPPGIHTTHQAVSSYPGQQPDGYLTVAEEGGIVGLLLLLIVGCGVASTLVRRDLLSSCAIAGVVSFVVAAAVDYDWQLPAVALVAGSAAGLASRAPAARAAVRSTANGPASRPHFGIAPIAWVVAVVLTVVAQTLVGATVETGTAAAQTAGLSPASNPDVESPARMILEGPDPTDPYMFRFDNRYYLYASEGTSFLNVPLWTGSRLGRWNRPVDVLPHLPGWAEGGLTWAPDVYKVAGGWGLYFTALLRGSFPLTHCIGFAFADAPSGPFVPLDHPSICQLDHRGSIDARVFATAGGGLYLLWKSEDNANPTFPGPDQDGPTGIYAERLSADGKRLLGAPVKILAPSEPWEGTIVEAPDMVEAWGTYWLFFSGNWFDTTAYGIGVAACAGPLGPCSDVQPAPFLTTNRQGVGPGEESIFREGSALYLLYNPFRADDPGPVIPRPVAMVRLGFTPKGPYLAAT